MPELPTQDPDELGPHLTMPGVEPEEPGRTPFQEMWHQAGGISGLIYSSLPVLVFVIAVSLWTLIPALIAALVVAVLIFLWRLVRRDSLQPAVAGFMSVGVSALIAYLLGEAKGYFLIGIWANLFWGVVFTVSVLIRRPAVGYAWSWATGRDTSWRENRRALLAYDFATVAWIVLFLTRFVVQQWLYMSAAPAVLGGTRIAMGWPLTAVGALVTLLAIRYVRRLAGPDAEPAPSA